ncbi:MAG: hypothetical protein AAF221_02255 [Pseudomonadota bacterium]
MTKMATIFALALCLLSSAARADDHKMEVGTCDNEPVVMVVNGVTFDRPQMQAYGKAISDNGIYEVLRGYYLNMPLPIAVFEGDVPKNYTTLIVRFPCFAHAKAFWYSDVYQNVIKPMRTKTNAGKYTVTVYKEIDIPAYMTDKVQEAPYLETFDVSPSKTIEQID